MQLLHVVLELSEWFSVQHAAIIMNSSIHISKEYTDSYILILLHKCLSLVSVIK